MKLGKKWVAFALIFVAQTAMLGQQPAPRLIDVHVHYDGEPGFLPQMLTRLDREDGLAFLLTTPKALTKASEFIKQHPNRFIGFGDIKLDSPDVLQQIDRFHAAGFRGLGEITSSKHNYDDRVYWPIYERALKYHMILLFHTGVVMRADPKKSEDVSFDRMRITRLDLIARRFPKLTLIGAHMGNPDYAEAAEIGRWNPNLYFDLSGSSLIKKQNNYAYFKSIFWWSGIVSQNTPETNTSAFEKLVFGSDDFGDNVTEFDSALERYHKMLDACGVPKHAQAMIFSGTMWNILQRQQAEMKASASSTLTHAAAKTQ